MKDLRSCRPKQIAAAVALAAAAAAIPAWSAPPSSPAESRGYQACVAAAAHQIDLLTVHSHYFIYDHQDSRRYYLNGYARRQNGAEPVKIACDTTTNGSHLLDVHVDEGRYAGRLVGTMNVADN